MKKSEFSDKNPLVTFQGTFWCNISYFHEVRLLHDIGDCSQICLVAIPKLRGISYLSDYKMIWILWIICIHKA